MITPITNDKIIAEIANCTVRLEAFFDCSIKFCSQYLFTFIELYKANIDKGQKNKKDIITKYK